ncbi:MAG: hypothetical protein Q4G09_00255 [Clostridia bacterium]|nr:hypothetical protein [Clostridia bacterium]
MNNYKELYDTFLKEKINEYCNDNGYLEIYWDYRDSLDPQTLLNAYKNYKKEGFDCIKDYLENELINYNLDYDSYLYKNIETEIQKEKFFTEKFKEWYEETCDLREDLIENGYQGIDCYIEELLNRSNFYINIMFATSEERNSDMSNIIRSYGTYHEPYYENLISDDFDNALTYIIHQQGHYVKEYFDILNNFNEQSKDVKNSFIKTVVEDIANNSSDSMSEITLLVKMNGMEALNFLEYKDNIENNKYLKFDKTVMIGIFNEWSGCGGLLEIILDKDLIIPKEFIREFQIEGAKNNGYSVDEVYGLIKSCWKEDILNYTNESPSLINEDIEETIKYVQNNLQLEVER